METDVHFYVMGRVQGVGYRAWAVRMAQTLGLCGWVRNRRNGCVEILARGSDENIRLFQKACLSGPAWSRVDSLAPATECEAFLPPVPENTFCQMPTV